MKIIELLKSNDKENKLLALELLKNSDKYQQIEDLFLSHDISFEKLINNAIRVYQQKLNTRKTLFLDYCDWILHNLNRHSIDI